MTVQDSSCPGLLLTPDELLRREGYPPETGQKGIDFSEIVESHKQVDAAQLRSGEEVVYFFSITPVGHETI